LRQLAREFTVAERHRGEPNVLRLLTQPIDRYQDPEAGIEDGAAFVFAYGTNPELVLLLECDRDRWQWAVARLSWAELTVERAGREVARFPQLSAFPNEGVYQTQGYTVDD
jgi:hypothetical protein